MVLKSNIRSSALPRPAPQHDSEYFFDTLELYLTTLFSKIFCFSDFFGETGQDRKTDIWTDRLFSENIVLEMVNMSKEG